MARYLLSTLSSTKLTNTHLQRLLMAEDAPEIIRIPNQPYPLAPVPDPYDDLRGTSTPLVIDNGSTNVRFGFATSSEPHTVLNVVSRYKDRKQNRPVMLMGDAVDAETGARAQARTPWEGDVLLNFDALVSFINFGFNERRF